MDESTLLVCFSFAEEDVTYHEPYWNPHFYIEVLDGQSGQIIHRNDPQYQYPTENAFNQGQSSPTNPDWPYYCFLAVPSGDSVNFDRTSQIADPYGNFNYYWALPQATPTKFFFRECPDAQNGPSTSYTVKWFEYKPIAFDLKEYAIQGKSVKLRIRTRACGAFVHWNYALFYARMIPGNIKVDACGSVPIHLSVPKGFQENTYEWHYGYNAQDAANRPPLQLNTPGSGMTGNIYDVYLDRDIIASSPNGRLWPYYCCNMLSYTGIPFTYEADVRSYFVEPDFTFQQNSNNCDISAQLTDNSKIRVEIPPTSQGATTTIINQSTQHIEWYFKNVNTGQFDHIIAYDNLPPPLSILSMIPILRLCRRM